MLHTALTSLFLGITFFVTAQINYSANDVVTPYTGGFRTGVNFGEYSGFDEIQQANLAAGNRALQTTRRRSEIHSTCFVRGIYGNSRL